MTVYLVKHKTCEMWAAGGNRYHFMGVPSNKGPHKTTDQRRRAFRFPTRKAAKEYSARMPMPANWVVESARMEQGVFV